MKRFVSILLLLAFFLPELSKISVMIDFKINQDFISKVLCINKENPISTCNGKCYLSKKLKELDEQEKENTPINQLQKINISPYIVEDTGIIALNDCPEDLTINIFSEQALLYISSFSDEIFHPPKSILV